MTPTPEKPQSALPALGKYQLTRKIAQSNDIVWEGYDPKLKRRVAVKELAFPPDLQGQPRLERIERFYREARAAALLNHPNIVTIYTSGEDQGRYFIAMEFLEGQTLRDRIGTAGPLPLSDAVHIAVSMADALEYAHQNGVIHRDIKPENIYLLNDGRVKLTDFGIARITGETQLTIAGQVFGTPSYMSPEQIMGRETDYRSDLFSLGVLLFEMLTGRKPFTTQGDTVVTITYRIMNEPTPIAVGVGPALDAVIQHATAKDPSQRYRSAADFRAALLAAANARPTLSPVAPPGYEPSYPPAAGNRTMLGDPTLFGGNREGVGYSALGIGNPTPNHPITQSPNYQTPNYPTPNTQHPTPASSRWAVIAILLVVLSASALGGGYALVKAFQNQSAQSAGMAAAGMCNHAVELYNQRRYQDALAVFLSARSLPTADARTVSDASRGAAYCYLAFAQDARSQNNLPDALRQCQEAMKLAPDDPEVKKLWAELQAPASVPANGSPAPAPNSAPPPLVSGSPPSDAPRQNQSDFLAANEQARANAADFLRQGNDAFNSGDKNKALELWSQAVQVGNGTPPTQDALRYKKNVTEGRRPDDDGNGANTGNNGGAGQ